MRKQEEEIQEKAISGNRNEEIIQTKEKSQKKAKAIRMMQQYKKGHVKTKEEMCGRPRSAKKE